MFSSHSLDMFIHVTHTFFIQMFFDGKTFFFQKVEQEATDLSNDYAARKRNMCLWNDGRSEKKLVEQSATYVTR